MGTVITIVLVIWYIIAFWCMLDIQRRAFSMEKKINAIFNKMYKIDNLELKKVKLDITLDEFNERLKKIKKLQEEKNVNTTTQE